MKLERVELIQVAVPFASEFRSGVSALTACEALLVRVDGEGVTGWGEVVADKKPSYAPETRETARHCLRDFLVPALTGVELTSVESALARFAWVRGHPMAKAGLELALWDWFGRAERRSLSSMLGGTRPRVQVGVSVGLASDAAALRATLEGYLRDGYERFKLKITPSALEAPLATAREVIGAHPLAADANGTFTRSDAARLRALGPLLFLEQPLAWDDLVEHAALKRDGAPPIALDESIGAPASLESALALRSLDVVNVKPGRIGGLLAAKQCLERAHAAGVGTFVGGMLETAIGRAGNVALASLASVTLASDLSATARYFREDLGTPFVLREGSTLDVPTGPGLGIEVDPQALARFTVSREALIGR